MCYDDNGDKAKCDKGTIGYRVSPGGREHAAAEGMVR